MNNYKVIAVVESRKWPVVGAKMGRVTQLGEFVTFQDQSLGWGKLDALHWIPISSVELVQVATPLPTNDPYLFTVPMTGRYFRCLHDYETDIWGGKPRTGLQGKPMPETVPMLDKVNFIPLNKAWQDFWFGLLVKAADGTMRDRELVAAWASLTADKRAFTDQHAVQNGFCDYIQGINLGAKPISIKTLTCGGNMLQAISVGKGVSFATLSSLFTPSVDSVWGNQALIHWATEATHIKFPDRSFQVGRFPQLLGKGVPIPIISMTGVNFMSRDRLIEMRPGQQYSPYNPPSA